MRSKYKLILFDADDILFDFRASERIAFLQTVSAFTADVLSDELFASYQEINRDLWLDYEHGKIQFDILKIERFHRLFQKHKINGHPEKTNEIYFDHLSNQTHLVDGAQELCARLVKTHALGIVTNGAASVQRGRLNRSPLRDFFSVLVISDECGFAKPDRRIFDYTLEQAKVGADEALMVGDRLEADILGAENVGMDSCWFNPQKKVNPSPILPTFEIAELSSLHRYIE